MPRYFFNLRHHPGPGGLAVDPDDDELADETAIREQAFAGARDLIARGRNATIRDWMVCAFEITDDEGRPVLTNPFSDTVPDDAVWG
jgi:hypothetical protein